MDALNHLRGEPGEALNEPTPENLWDQTPEELLAALLRPEAEAAQQRSNREHLLLIKEATQPQQGAGRLPDWINDRAQALSKLEAPPEPA